MINLLFIDNLPLSLVLIYLIVGIYLTFMSFDIGYEEFDVKKIPKWLVLFFCVLIPLAGFLATAIIKGFIGFYLLFIVSSPYIAIKRQFYFNTE